MLERMESKTVSIELLMVNLANFFLEVVKIVESDEICWGPTSANLHSHRKATCDD